MARHHLIRVGAMGHVGRFVAVDATRYPRRTRVIVRTVRGLEIGEVLAPPAQDSDGAADGAILRGMTVEDQLLEVRLEKNRQRAFTACADLLARRQLRATLLDVEQLFDGRRLFFYFLGDVQPEVAALTHELADAYDAEVQMRKFSAMLTAGCGPGCGTDAAIGGGCGSCGAGCAVAGACRVRNN